LSRKPGAVQMTGEWLNTTGAAQQSPEHRS
ncbi:TPA: hypothetical protein ACGGRX_005258, partial [Escherichia coli]